jgi:hypothetical protein
MQMALAFNQEHIKELVTLLVEIGDLRAKLSAARGRIQERNPVTALDENGDDIIAAAERSERELVSIAASILRRLKDAGCLGEVLSQPLNKYEEAHFDMARESAHAIDAYCARKSN